MSNRGKVAFKTGDTVKVIAGKDRGKTGKVLQVFPVISRASVDGVNLLVRHLRSQKRGEKGQKIQFPSPIHISNLKKVDAPKAEPKKKVEAKAAKPAAKAADKTKKSK